MPRIVKLPRQLRQVFLLLAIIVAPVSAWALSVGQMTTNGRTHPLGIAASDISLGWSIVAETRDATQNAYLIRVGTTEGGNDVWDSGRVASDRQLDITLPADLKLAPVTRYYWQVKLWDGHAIESSWSTPAWFETGLLSAADWSGAQWITRADAKPDASQWTDYIATVEFSIERDAFGVLLRASPDARNGYLYQINVTGNQPVLKPHTKVNGVYRELARVDLAPFGFTNADLLKGKHTLVFELRGSTLTTTLDGKKIDTRKDPTFREGLIGFRTNGRERGEVHRIRVNDPSGRVLFASDFANGKSGFTGGTVAGGSYHLSGNTEALFTGTHSSLPLLRDEFQTRGEIKSARLYASAHGLYQLSLNGQKVGDQFLAPGWTDYNQRIQCQTYDVTRLLKPGANALGAALADGWYRGKVGLNWTRVYGDTLALVAKLHVTYADGSSQWFGTDDSWRAGVGPFVRGDLQDGETYDARLEQSGWDRPGFDASSWSPVAVVSTDVSKLVPQPDEPVRVTDIRTANDRTMPAPNIYVYDLGQNMVGVARVKITGRSGQTARIRYAEELYRKGDRKGSLYTDNFRSARVTDTYTFARDETVTYQPTFTQHGFRYVEITGLDTPPESKDVQGIVLGSDLPNIGDLRLSDPMLDQLVRNIRWGQRGNFLSIPTDTPARDERLGWTGDISVFAPTASRYQDTRAFLSKWMSDVRDSQRADGNIPAIVPQPRHEFNETGVGWSDAFITVPHAVWRATGDVKIVRENWDAMKRFYRFVHDSATKDGNLLEEGRSSWFSGDWLNLEGVDRLKEHQVIASAYFAEDTRMMAEMASALGDSEQAAEWSALVPRIREAFTRAYCQPDGRIRMGTQTVYAMTLGMDLIPDPVLRDKVAARFVEKLAADNNHLKTGFLGTPWLLPALSSIDRDDLAMRLLLNKDYPSWGFEIGMGATTMWERWNTLRANGEFGPVQMNSFNHYAYGAVADWMFQHLGGLQIVEPGYKKSRIAPLIGAGGLDHASCDIHTPYGLLSCAWKLAGGRLTLEATVPVNTTAEIVIPAANPEAVRESGIPATTAPGVKTSAFKDGRLTLLVGSGHYTFTTQ